MDKLISKSNINGKTVYYGVGKKTSSGKIIVKKILDSKEARDSTLSHLDKSYVPVDVKE